MIWSRKSPWKFLSVSCAVTLCFLTQPMITRRSLPGWVWARLNRDWQFFEGSSLLVFQDHLTELHHATPKLQHQFIDDAARVAAALTKTFPDIKLNHGLFGNAEPHLHWHMIVRRETDPTPRTTIWESDFPIMTKSEEDFRSLAAKIRLNLPPN